MLFKQGLSYLKAYPKDQLARLLVDSCLYDPAYIHKHKFTDYESREPGCTASYFNALEYLIGQLENTITVEFIKKLHFLCTEHLLKSVELSETFTPGHFRASNTYTTFSISNRHATRLGIYELIHWMNRVKGGAFYCTNNLFKNQTQLIDAIYNAYENLSPEDAGLSYISPMPNNPWDDFYFHREINKIINYYYAEINKNSDENHKLLIMAQTIESLERLHPFQDGNGRTFVNLLLNFMLMQNGFPPVTLYDPNIFDAFGTKYVVMALKAGMNATLLITQSSEVYHYSLSEEDKQYSLENSLNLVKTLEQYQLPAPNFTRKYKLGAIPENQSLKTNITLNPEDKISGEGVTRLHRAAKIENNAFMLNYYLNKGDFINFADVNGGTALHISAECGHDDNVITLLEKGANIDQQKLFGETPLLSALTNNQVNTALLLIAHNANVNLITRNGASALFIAARMGNQTLVDALLNKNARLISFRCNRTLLEQQINNLPDDKQERGKRWLQKQAPNAFVKINPYYIAYILGHYEVANKIKMHFSGNTFGLFKPTSVATDEDHEQTQQLKLT